LVRKKVEIKEHVLLLKHEILDEKSSVNLLKKYNITNKQLPFVYKKDPALRELKDIKVGDIVGVVRDSATSGKTKFYRMVIDG
jgi:DNA-directed RNA polymerase subunit H (RpoH/RPB5)